jgi:hypothetical protein
MDEVPLFLWTRYPCEHQNSMTSSFSFLQYSRLELSDTQSL